jgi:uridine kinase
MILIAIDGPAGAGKTTLAEKLLHEYSVSQTVTVIHMDDLYNGWTHALNEELTSRLNEILHRNSLGVPFDIEIFNWSSMKFDGVQRIQPTEVLIIEGVGAAQKIVRDAGATTFWLDIEPSIGLQRVLARDGHEIEVFMHQWQLDQEIHFLRDKTRENAQYIQRS